MLSGVGLETVHGMKWEIAVSDQNSEGPPGSDIYQLLLHFNTFL